MKQIWKIAGQSIRPGERLETYIAVEGTKEVMPVTFINGKGEGKTVLLTSGIHGGEYEGIRAATELARCSFLRRNCSGRLPSFILAVCRHFRQNRRISLRKITRT